MTSIEIDGKTVEVESGSMVIEAADKLGVTIPRFCYHKKLSVAANCRMCLVEIEKARKPMPACATPVTDGMKVFTKSPMALAAQKAVMEFLLINHPLDCPICDQGGECELQDVSMGYGEDVSGFAEGKRAVEGDDLGPLISTEMTRCIHCTRCVRFGEEVAGIRELGATGRGEAMQIGTYIKHSIQSEVSGNIIDLCPVGALTSRPFRFTARAWELRQHSSVAAHDCLGSNTSSHVRRHELMRVVPRENEEINETWLSDRDRFSYTGLSSKERLTKPMVKKEGSWCEVEWDEALQVTAEGIKKIITKHGPEAFAAFCSPQSTTEEAFLLQKCMRGLGVENLDCRVHQVDFADQHALPMAPVAQHPISEIEQAKAVFLIGSNVQREQPLLGLRVRKASMNGASVVSLNAVDYNFNFELEAKNIVSPQALPLQLAAIITQLLDSNLLTKEQQRLLEGIKINEQSQQIARVIHGAGEVTILLGALAQNHPEAAAIRSLVHLLESHFNVKVYRLTEGANEAGCHYAGMLPHRGPFGAGREKTGLDIQAALNKKMKGYLLHNIEAELDIASPNAARQALLAGEFVVMLTSFKSTHMFDYADVLLPTATYAETSGCFVNVNDEWQRFRGVTPCPGDARPAWKVIRVLANLFDISDFDYAATSEVLKEIEVAKELAPSLAREDYQAKTLARSTAKLVRIGEWPMYRIDSVCRHAKPLQESAANEKAEIRIHPRTARKYKVQEVATVSQGEIEITLPLVCDDRVAEGAVYIANAWPESSDLGHAYSPIEIKVS